MTDLFFTWIISPLESSLHADWFYSWFLIAAFPYVFLIQFSRYTRSFFKHRHRRSRNYKHRCFIAYLALGGNGVLSYSPCFTGGNCALPSPERLKTIQWKHRTIPTSSIATFLDDIDVLRQYQLLTMNSSFFTRGHYTPLHQSDPTYHRILLEAQRLQTQLYSYEQPRLPSHPSVYISTKSHELPIVIDTGASCSVTPNIHDFVNNPLKADTTKMEGLNGESTEVVGEGTVKWRIEDQNGTVEDIETMAYYIPTANIRLFSPQIYITEQHRKQKTNCHLLLDKSGITLTTAKGVALNFPIQHGSNLPFMLTEKALKRSTPRDQSSHTRQLNRFANLASFLCSSTFESFNRESLFNSTIVKGTASKINDSKFVLQRANWNLTDAQRELLL